VLTGPIGRPESVRGQQRLTNVMSGVVRDAVSNGRAGEKRQLPESLLGLLHEGRRPRLVGGHDLEPPRLHQRGHGRLLDLAERSQVEPDKNNDPDTFASMAAMSRGFATGALAATSVEDIIGFMTRSAVSAM
jgi:hypothetical protein